MAKQISKRLVGLLDDPIVKAILDKSTPLTEELINTVIGYWKTDLYERKPAPAFDGDTYVGTTLDMSTFLLSLTGRGAVVNIPEYERIRQAVVKEGEHVISDKNRHGVLKGLTSNADTFIMSIMINDMNVMTTDGVGEDRNYSMTDFNGDWYEGWKSLQFMPDQDENKFLYENNILSHDKITFANFVHPNRWISIYGKHYTVTKLLIDRLTSEASNMFMQMKAMKANGVSAPAPEGGSATWVTSAGTARKSKTVSESKSIKVDAYNFEIDVPDNGTEFPTYDETWDNHEMLRKLRSKLIFGYGPALKFAVRCSEMAFIRHGLTKDGKVKMPAWFQNADWEDNYKIKGKKIIWNRLVLFQPEGRDEQGHFLKGVAIRYRKKLKSEMVDVDYNYKPVDYDVAV